MRESGRGKQKKKKKKEGKKSTTDSLVKNIKSVGR